MIAVLLFCLYKDTADKRWKKELREVCVGKNRYLNKLRLQDMFTIAKKRTKHLCTWFKVEISLIERLNEPSLI
jgi:hypothetical protein